MAADAQEERWNHTAEVLAFHAELNRDEKKRLTPFTSNDFHPFRSERPEVPQATDEDQAAAERYARDINRMMTAPENQFRAMAGLKPNGKRQGNSSG